MGRLLGCWVAELLGCLVGWLVGWLVGKQGCGLLFGVGLGLSEVVGGGLTGHTKSLRSWLVLHGAISSTRQWLAPGMLEAKLRPLANVRFT